MVKIMVKKSGNCGCYNCGKIQEGGKLHPYTVWHRRIDENRGHNDPVCSMECAKEYAEKFGFVDFNK